MRKWNGWGEFTSDRAREMTLRKSKKSEAKPTRVRRDMSRNLNIG